MEKKTYHPLSDMSIIKEELISLFSKTETICKLNEGFFDRPYSKEVMTDMGCAVFVETYLTELEGGRIKEVALDISVICAESTSKLTGEQLTYYNSFGIYGNRVDCILQAIHSTITDSDAVNSLKKKFCIGSLTLVPKNPIERCDTDAGFYGKQLHYSYRSFFSSQPKGR